MSEGISRLEFYQTRTEIWRFFWMRMDADLPHLHGYNVRPPATIAFSWCSHNSNVTNWFMVRK